MTCTSLADIFWHKWQIKLVIYLTCNVELHDIKRLHSKNMILKYENSILHQQLFKAGQINQNNEIHIRTLNIQLKNLSKLRKTLINYQNICVDQQETLENKKRECALTAQSLHHEFKCYEVTERVLKHKCVYVQNLINFLNTLNLSRCVDSNNNADIDTLYLDDKT